MASRSALIALLVAVSCAAAASAETFIVGDAQGWTVGGPDYDAWARGKTFSVGDTLVFNFQTGTHDVLVVSKSDYDACSKGNAMNTIQNGPANVTLTSAGDHYYICGVGTHCSGGMKLAVNVGSGSGSPSPSTPSTPGIPTPTTPAGPSPSAAPARRAAGPALAVAAGVLLKLALF